MKFKIVNMINDMEKLEQIRKESIGVSMDQPSYYFEQLKNGSIIPIAALYNDNIVGGVYVSSSQETLYIEYIFVDEEYQNKGIGSSLIKYVLENKELFEDIFKNKFILSKLEPNSDKIVNFYKNLGYSEPNELNMMKKRI